MVTRCQNPLGKMPFACRLAAGRVQAAASAVVAQRRECHSPAALTHAVPSVAVAMELNSGVKFFTVILKSDAF